MIAQALGLHEPPEEAISEHVSAYLGEQHCLLVLDNFEQVIEAAPFVADLLSTCPHLSVLVTSRVHLRLRAEHILPLAPLPVEDAVALFQDRATAIQPGRLYASQEVAAICERLDRLPLAIELAAMHVKTLSFPDCMSASFIAWRCCGWSQGPASTTANDGGCHCLELRTADRDTTAMFSRAGQFLWGIGRSRQQRQCAAPRKRRLLKR